MAITRDETAWVHAATVVEGEASIGFCSRVGDGATMENPVRLGDGVEIGAFCIIEAGAELGPGVAVDHYCRIGSGVQAGAGTRILYRAQVFDDVQIGQNCIIAGELVDRTVVENNVRFQGSTAHRHTDATADWDTTEEPSPIIKGGSVVGVGALVIGGVTVGPRAYIAAGERVTCDVPAETVLRDGKLTPLSKCRGMIRVGEP